MGPYENNDIRQQTVDLIDNLAPSSDGGATEETLQAVNDNLVYNEYSAAALLALIRETTERIDGKLIASGDDFSAAELLKRIDDKLNPKNTELQVVYFTTDDGDIATQYIDWIDSNPGSRIMNSMTYTNQSNPVMVITFI